MAIGNTTEQWLGGVAISIGGAVFLSGCGTTTFQVISWLRDGTWIPLTFQRFWAWLNVDPYGFGVIGSQAIWHEMLNWPLGMALVMMGTALFWLGSRLAD